MLKAIQIEAIGVELRKYKKQNRFWILYLAIGILVCVLATKIVSKYKSELPATTKNSQNYLESRVDPSSNIDQEISRETFNGAFDIGSSAKAKSAPSNYQCDSYFHDILAESVAQLIERSKQGRLLPDETCARDLQNYLPASWFKKISDACSAESSKKDCELYLTFLRAVALRELLGSHPDLTGLSKEQLILYSMSTAMLDPADPNSIRADQISIAVMEELSHRDTRRWLPYELRLAALIGFVSNPNLDLQIKTQFFSEFESEIQKAKSVFSYGGELIDADIYIRISRGDGPAEIRQYLAQTNPNDKSLWMRDYFEAWTYFKEGDRNQAKAILQKNADSDPDHPRVQQTLECLKAPDCEKPFRIQWKNPLEH